MEAWKDELYHHGILGMKWGVRRYQNPDGSLTEEGKLRYGGQYVEHLAKATTKSARNQNAQNYKDKVYKRSAKELKNDDALQKFQNKMVAKYGPDYLDNSDYATELNNFLELCMYKTNAAMILEDLTSDENYKKAQELCEKYDMESWLQVAQRNRDFINDTKMVIDSLDKEFKAIYL